MPKVISCESGKRQSDASHRLSYSQIRKQFQKPFHRENPYAWLVTRRLSALATYFLQFTAISPNNVTIVALLVGVSAGLALIGPSTMWTIVAVAGLQLSYVLDCTDGELARLRNDFSNKGVYLDYLMHYFIDSAVFVGLAARSIVATDSPGSDILMMIGAIAYLLNKVLLDLGFRLVVESAERPGSSTAAPLTRTNDHLVNKVIGIYPRPGFLWQSVPLHLIVSAVALADRIWPIELLPKVAIGYALVNIIALIVCTTGIYLRGAVHGGKWQITFDPSRVPSGSNSEGGN